MRGWKQVNSREEFQFNLIRKQPRTKLRRRSWRRKKNEWKKTILRQLALLPSPVKKVKNSSFYWSRGAKERLAVEFVSSRLQKSQKSFRRRRKKKNRAFLSWPVSRLLKTCFAAVSNLWFILHPRSPPPPLKRSLIYWLLRKSLVGWKYFKNGTEIVFSLWERR